MKVLYTALDRKETFNIHFLTETFCSGNFPLYSIEISIVLQLLDILTIH